MTDEQFEKLLAAVLTVASYAGKTGGADPVDAVDRYHEIHRLLHAAEQRAHVGEPGRGEGQGGGPKGGDPFGGVKT